MPADGTRVVYHTVISTCPVMMPDPIVLGMLKQCWVVVLLGLTALALGLFRRRIILAALLGWCFGASPAGWLGSAEMTAPRTNAKGRAVRFAAAIGRTVEAAWMSQRGFGM
jgi:hypothetical protein